MEKECPPVALVETWLFLLKADNAEIIEDKRRAYQAIRMNFGSISEAELCVKQRQENANKKFDCTKCLLCVNRKALFNTPSNHKTGIWPEKII